jgi:hypothetical protein
VTKERAKNNFEQIAFLTMGQNSKILTKTSFFIKMIFYVSICNEKVFDICPIVPHGFQKIYSAI